MEIKGHGKHIRMFISKVRDNFKVLKKEEPKLKYMAEVTIMIGLPDASASETSSFLAAAESAIKQFSEEAFMSSSVSIHPIVAPVADFEAAVQESYNSGLKLLVPDKKIVTPEEAAREQK